MTSTAIVWLRRAPLQTFSVIFQTLVSTKSSFTRSERSSAIFR
jgi:hypothetical protein